MAPYFGYARADKRHDGEPITARVVADLLLAVGVAHLLLWHDSDTAPEVLREPRLERAIGVIYRPATERISHYFGPSLPDQFDRVLHFDETRAVEPLERNAEWEKGELPETFPFAVQIYGTSAVCARQR